MVERKHQDYESKGLLNLIRRNELLILISLIIFFGSLAIGFFLSAYIDQIMAQALNSFKDSISKGEIQLTTSSIFLNNIKIAIYLYGGGIFVGITTVIMLAYNGLFIGYAASKFNLGEFIIFTLPHGIFEISGIIIAGAAGLRLASTIINILRDVFNIKNNTSILKQLKSIMRANSFEFQDSLKLFIIAAILIFIAAIIEANFTLAWGNYIRGVI